MAGLHIDSPAKTVKVHRTLPRHTLQMSQSKLNDQSLKKSNGIVLQRAIQCRRSFRTILANCRYARVCGRSFVERIPRFTALTLRADTLHARRRL